jgi:hypothetical protein
MRCGIEVSDALLPGTVDGFKGVAIGTRSVEVADRRGAEPEFGDFHAATTEPASREGGGLGHRRIGIPRFAGHVVLRCDT